MKKIHLLFIGLALLTYGCKESATDQIDKKGNQLKVTYKKGPYSLGQMAKIELDKSATYDSLFLNGRKVLSFKGGQSTFNVPLDFSGNKSYILKAYEQGNERKTTLSLSAYPASAPIKRDFEIVKVLEHDPTSYTQGYEIHNGFIYESRGQYGQSGMRRLKFYDTKVNYEIPLPPDIFGEGLTIMDSLIYQLTWKSKRCYVYRQDMQLEELLTIPMVEGWGLCNNGEYLMASDGSNLIYHLDKKMGLQKVVAVYAQTKPLQKLNELEYVNGKVYANIYTTDEIVSFDPQTGAAESYLNLSSLRTHLTNPKAEVLNGIAYIAESDEFLVTGKYWDKAFIIKLLP